MTEQLITVDIPGAYYSTLESSGVIQHRGDLAMCGYPGAPAVYAAWTQGRTIKRGKGESLRLTFTPDVAADALDCLIDYADTHLDGIEVSMPSSVWEPDDYRQADRERQAIKRLLTRLRTQRKELGQ